MNKGQPAWVEVIQHLKMILGMIDKNPGELIDIRNIAPVYAELGKAYNKAVEQSGLSSMRARAVAKALDLTTNKSDIQSFLGELDV